MAAKAMSRILVHRQATRPMRAACERRPRGAADKLYLLSKENAFGPKRARVSTEERAELDVQAANGDERIAWPRVRVSDERVVRCERLQRCDARSFDRASEGRSRLGIDDSSGGHRGRELDARRRRVERQENDEASDEGASQPKQGPTPRRHPIRLTIAG
jgi:hypothetical protein